MQELGKTLKRAREEKGLTLRDIERATKIGIRMLEQIESGEFHKLPEGVFARNFVRQYCEFVDMDPEPVLIEAFNGGLQPADQEEELGVEPARPMNWWPVLVAVAVILVLMLWVWPGWLRGQRDSSDQITPASRTSEPLHDKEDVGVSATRGPAIDPLDSDEATAVGNTGPNDAGLKADGAEEDPASPEDRTITMIQPEDNSQLKAEATGQQINDAQLELAEGPVAVLEFQVTDRCWVNLQCPQRDMDFMLEAGEVYTTRCGYPVQLTLGNAPAVTLTVNGQRVRFPVDVRVLRDFVIDASFGGVSQ